MILLDRDSSVPYINSRKEMPKEPWNAQLYYRSMPVHRPGWLGHPRDVAVRTGASWPLF